jgi:hypothetical protein
VQDKRLRVVLLAAVILPAALFYLYLQYLLINLPLFDDYDIALNFGNHLSELRGFAEKLIYLISARDNEYKLILAHLLVWSQITVAGHVNFKVLSALGNLSVLFIGIALWKMFLPGAEMNRRLALFIPVSLLLFQGEYVETLNWSTVSIQNLAVIACAVWSILLLVREGVGAFIGAVMIMVLGVASSANGFLIAAVGVMVLVVHRRTYWAVVAWAVVAALCFAVYAYHYSDGHVQSPGHLPLSVMLMHPPILYLFSFLGAVSHPYTSENSAGLALSMLVGLGFVMLFCVAAMRGYFRQHPAVGYCLLFVLLTGVGVSGARAGFGLSQSVSSRYRIYSDLLLIFAWFVVVAVSRMDKSPALSRDKLLRSVVVISSIFWMAMNAHGVLALHGRNQELKSGMALFKDSMGAVTPVYRPKVPSVVCAKSPGSCTKADEDARETLIKSENLGIFKPQ